MIKAHCPDLAHGADAQLQCVPGADARWQLGGDVEDFGVRCLTLRAILIVTSSSERDGRGFGCKHSRSDAAEGYWVVKSSIFSRLGNSERSFCACPELLGSHHLLGSGMAYGFQRVAGAHVMADSRNFRLKTTIQTRRASRFNLQG
jgi:hypothetical protein